MFVRQQICWTFEKYKVRVLLAKILVLFAIYLSPSLTNLVKFSCDTISSLTPPAQFFSNSLTKFCWQHQKYTVIQRSKPPIHPSKSEIWKLWLKKSYFRREHHIALVYVDRKIVFIWYSCKSLCAYGWDQSKIFQIRYITDPKYYRCHFILNGLFSNNNEKIKTFRFRNVFVLKCFCF